MNTPFPEQPSHEAHLHECVVKLVADMLKEQGLNEVYTNPSDAQDHAVPTEQHLEQYPDVFALENNEVQVVCKVETPSTVQSDAVTEWKEYESLGKVFLLVVPQAEAQYARL